MIQYRNKGGDIQHPILKKILSIGFELESSNISKFTLLENTDNTDNVLINTDTAGQDLGRLYKQLEKKNAVKGGTQSKSKTESNASIGSSVEEEEDDFQRRQEIFEVDAYTTKSLKLGKGGVLKKEPNSSMLVANDMAVTPTTKYLKKMCKPREDDVIQDALEFEEEDLDQEAREEIGDAAAHEFKNQLYTFETDQGKRYPLAFAMANKKDCGMFSKVEWIFTYYQPHHSGNIVLDAFANVARNLDHHLKKLTSETGQLVMNFSSKNRHVVPSPSKRQLFHLPGTNLHYMQTHFYDKPETLDDICIVPQMTYSCQVADLLPVTKALIYDSLNVNADYHALTQERMTLIERLEQGVDQLIAEFSKMDGGFSLLDKDPVVAVQTVAEPKIAVQMKNYMFLFLFKLYQYYNHYLQDEDVKANADKIMYLKDALFINSRHSNYALYQELKSCMGKLMSNSSESQIAKMVQQLIVQPAVLTQFMLEEPGNVRKNAFSPRNVLEKGHKNYGDPHYSLISYLQYFEDPEEDSRIKDVSVNYRDWLYHHDLDIFSNTMDIRNGVVLAEFRTFPRLLNTYMNSIADSKLFKELKFGACNRAKNKFTQFGAGFTVGALKQFADLYDKKQSQTKTIIEPKTSRLTKEGSKEPDRFPGVSRKETRRTKTSRLSRITKKNSRTTYLPVQTKSRSL
jgi:hypothetical protein